MQWREVCQRWFKRTLCLRLARIPFIHKGAVGIGISYKPDARVDFGVSVQKGFGGLAPVAVSVRFLLVSVGKSYEVALLSLTQQHRCRSPWGRAAQGKPSKTCCMSHPSDFPIDPQARCSVLHPRRRRRHHGKFGSRTP